MSLRHYFFLCISFGATLQGAVAIQDLCTTNTNLFAVSADDKPFQLDAIWAQESQYIGALLQQNAALGTTEDMPIKVPLNSDQLEMLNDYLLQLKNEKRKNGKLKKSLMSKISEGDRSAAALPVKVKELSELFSLIRIMRLEKLKPIALAGFLFLLKKETSLAAFVSNARLVSELELPPELTQSPVKLLEDEDQEFLRAQLCVTLKNDKPLLYCSVSPDSHHVVIAGLQKKDTSFIEVFDLKSGDSVYYVVLDYKIKGVHFCDGNRIITWGKKRVDLWDSFGLSNTTPPAWKDLYKDSKRIWGTALSTDRRHLALVLDEKIIVLSIRKGQSEASQIETKTVLAPPAYKRDNKKNNHSTIVFGNDDQLIIEVRPGGDLLFYEWEKEKFIAYKKNSGAGYRGFYTNGSKFVTISDTHEIRVWNCQQDTVEPITEGNIPVLSYDIIPHEQLTELKKGTVKIFCDTSSNEFIDNLAFLPTRKMSSAIVVDGGAPGMARSDVRGESYQKLPLPPSLALQGAYLSSQGAAFLGTGPDGLIKVWHMGNQEVSDFISSSMPLEQALCIQYLINRLRQENPDLGELATAYHLRRIFEECNETFRELMFAAFPDFRKAWEDNRPFSPHLNVRTRSTSESTTPVQSTDKLVRSASSDHRRITTSDRPETSVVSYDSSVSSPRRRRSHTSGAQVITGISYEKHSSPRSTLQTASPRSQRQEPPQSELPSMLQDRMKSPKRRVVATSGAQAASGVSQETYASPRGTRRIASPRVRKQEPSQSELLSMPQERMISPKRRVLGASGTHVETSVLQETYSSPRGTRRTASPRVRKQEPSTELSIALPDKDMSQETESPAVSTTQTSHSRADVGIAQDEHSGDQAQRVAQQEPSTELSIPLPNDRMSQETESPAVSTTQTSHSRADVGIAQDEHSGDQAQPVAQQEPSPELSIPLPNDRVSQETESPAVSRTQTSHPRTDTGIAQNEHSGDQAQPVAQQEPSPELSISLPNDRMSQGSESPSVSITTQTSHSHADTGISQDEHLSSGQQSSSGSQIVEFVVQDELDTPRVTEHDASEIVLVTPRAESPLASTSTSSEDTSTSSESTVKNSSASKDRSREVEAASCPFDVISQKALAGKLDQTGIETSPENTWKSSLKLTQTGEHIAHTLYKSAASFYMQGKYEEAYRNFQGLYKLSETKIYKALAAHVLGEMCFLGRGVEWNPAMACKFFEISSKQDVDKAVQAYACARLGEMYFYGYGVKQSQMNALYYLNQVIAHQQNLIVSNIDDEEVNQIDGEASFRSRIAALFLLHRAQCKDLKIDSTAEPVVSLYEQAMRLCEDTCETSSQDCAQAWLYRGRFLLAREKVSKAMSCFEIALSKATRSSNELLKAEAYYRLGKLHYTSSVDSLAQAKEYLKKARATNTNSWICPAAELYLGHIAFRESPSKKILSLQALTCYERALNQPYNLRVQSEAAYHIARIYELSDENIPQKKLEVLEDKAQLLRKKWEKVHEYDAKAVAIGEVLGIPHIDAHFSLARQHYEGTPAIEIDLLEAFKHFKIVAQESLNPSQIEEANLKLKVQKTV